MKDFTLVSQAELWRGRRGADSPIRLVGIRGALEASGQPNRMTIYDDMILRVIGETVTQWPASTDPSWPLVLHAINPSGAAQLCPGVHLFGRHLMHGKYPVLGQAEDVHVNRLDSLGAVKLTECGDFGICIHSGGDGMNTGHFSAGCQIISNPCGYFGNPTWKSFWDPISDGMASRHLSTVPYLLINAADLK